MSKAFTILQELANTIAKAPPKRQAFVDTISFERSKRLYPKMYKALVKNAVAKDEDLSSLIGLATYDKQYQVHRARFKQVLMNTLIALDLRSAGFSDLMNAEFRTDKELFLVKVLTRLGASTAATDVARPALRLALEYEFWEQARMLAAMLRSTAALRADLQEYNRLSNILNEAAEKARAEQDALERYERLVMEVASKVSGEGAMYGKVDELAKRTEADFERFGTYNLALFSFRLRTAAGQLIDDYQASLDACDKFQSRMEGAYRRFLNDARRTELGIKRINSLFHLRKYETALEAVRECDSLLAPGSNWWHTLKDFEFQILMHLLKFTEAKEVLTSVIHDSRFGLQPAYNVERWEIYSLYLNYALGVKKQSMDLVELRKRVPLLAKDKSGYYASLVILHILLLLQDGNFEAVINSIDLLRGLRQRHLSEEPHLSAFVHLLEILERSSFDPAIAKKKSKKALQHLSEANRVAFRGPQILPFEWLWGHILSQLAPSQQEATPSA